jgi:16S rRNA (guanine(966)-N(2))-methyltransferase RsmD
MGGLRVVGGTARGRKLRLVPGEGTRPIGDRVKEALFDILGADVERSRILDLFAGTGSVGIEALSRGASFVRFTELNRLAIATIRTNLEHTGLAAKAEVIHMDAFTLLHHQADRPFHYIYIAPPQYIGIWKRAVLALDANPSWMAEDAWVIVQIHPVEYEDFHTGSSNLQNLEEFKQRRYGSTLLVFYERKVVDCSPSG